MKKLWIPAVFLVIAAIGLTTFLFARVMTFESGIRRDMSVIPLKNDIYGKTVIDKDIDLWLLYQQDSISPDGMDQERDAHCQSLGVLLQKYHGIKVSLFWPSFSSNPDLWAREKGLIRDHQADYDWLMSYFTHRSAIRNHALQDGRIIDSPYPENTVSAVGEPTADEMWENYRTIGGGNGFYEENGDQYWQCTTFAWARFYEVYGFRSGARGNGCLHAQEIVRAHPTWFTITYYPVPVATFSDEARNGNKAGHVGFVEEVEGQYIWFSEGNVGTRGGIRFNYKMSFEEFFSRYPDVIFASPVGYWK